MAWLRSLATSALPVLLAACSAIGGNRDAPHDMAMGALLPGACEEPAYQNEGQLGCYFDTDLQLRNPPRELYWHIEEFADSTLAEAAKGQTGAVVSAYGRTFLYTINGHVNFAAAGGRHVTSIGPLPTPSADSVTARFMQAMTERGAMTRVHTHDGPEAFFLVSGAICMDSRSGPAITSAGQTYWIKGNVPCNFTTQGRTFVARSSWSFIHHRSLG